jgi:hypothetical protein
MWPNKGRAREKQGHVLLASLPPVLRILKPLVMRDIRHGIVQAQLSRMRGISMSIRVSGAALV